MSSQQPTGFENYPFRSDDSRIADPDPSPAPVVSPYQPPRVSVPTPSSGGGGMGRRGLVGLMIGIPVAGILGSAILSGDDEYEYAEGEATESSSDTTGEEPSDNEAGYYDLGDYSVNVPTTWDVTTGSSDELIATRGSNRVLAAAFGADGSKDVTDLLSELVEQHRGKFKGKLSEPVDTSFAEVQRATLATTGLLGKETARIRADVWIDANDDALLVVQTLTAKKGSTIADEAQGMADELSDYF